MPSPTNPRCDDHVLVTVNLMNMRNDIDRFLVEERVGELPAQRVLAINLRELADELEGRGA